MGMTDADHEARALAVLAATVAQRPPAALRARTLDAARAARPAGHLARRPSREPDPDAARDASTSAAGNSTPSITRSSR
jgi:hypothetical protein